MDSLRYGNSQAMFVVTSAGVIATDPIGYGRPQAVTTYIDEVRKVTNQPIKYVIYSHHHFDHIAGGKPFKDADARFVTHNILTFLQDASAEVKAAAREGKCWDTVEKELKLPKYSSWPNYETALPFVLRRYCGLWGRGT